MFSRLFRRGVSSEIKRPLSEDNIPLIGVMVTNVGLIGWCTNIQNRFDLVNSRLRRLEEAQPKKSDQTETTSIGGNAGVIKSDVSKDFINLVNF